MASLNVIKLKGDPIEDETLSASAATIKPGHLIETHIGTGIQLRNHSTASENAAKMWALNRDEKGQGPLETSYAISDQVKRAHFSTGMELRAMIQSGQTLTGIEPLESAGDGTLQVLAASAATSQNERNAIVAWSIETSGGALGADTLLAVRVA